MVITSGQVALGYSNLPLVSFWFPDRLWSIEKVWKSEQKYLSSFPFCWAVDWTEGINWLFGLLSCQGGIGATFRLSGGGQRTFETQTKWEFALRLRARVRVQDRGAMLWVISLVILLFWLLFLKKNPCRDTIGSSSIVGDHRWSGAFGVDADYVAKGHCSVEFISVRDNTVILRSTIT